MSTQCEPTSLTVGWLGFGGSQRHYHACSQGCSFPRGWSPTTHPSRLGCPSPISQPPLLILHHNELVSTHPSINPSIHHLIHDVNSFIHPGNNMTYRGPNPHCGVTRVGLVQSLPMAGIMGNAPLCSGLLPSLTLLYPEQPPGE